MSSSVISTTLGFRNLKVKKGDRLDLPVKNCTGLRGRATNTERVLTWKTVCPSSKKRVTVIIGNLWDLTLDEGIKVWLNLRALVKDARRTGSNSSVHDLLLEARGESRITNEELPPPLTCGPDVLDQYYLTQIENSSIKRPDVIKDIFKRLIFPHILQVEFNADGEIIEKGTPLCQVERGFVTDQILKIACGQHIPNEEKRPNKTYGGQAVASKTLTYSLSFFKWADATGKLNGYPNPLSSLSKKLFNFKAPKRDRFLYREEITPLFEAIEASEMSPQSKIALHVLLRTGVRRSELTNALWKNVDFEACSWFIPAEDAKNKSAIKIPLSQQLLELFHQLRDEAKGSKYVLGGLAPASLSKALKRLQDSGRLDLAQPIRLHDLRRSYSTFLGDLGVQPHVIEKALNHSLEGVAAIYNRADLYSERATAIKLLSDALESPIQLLPAKQKID